MERKSFQETNADLWLSALPTGGDDGIRTHDPLLAGQVLSQLSYTPIGFHQSLKIEQQLKVLPRTFRLGFSI